MADRENSRIQVFNANGDFVREWSHMVRPDDLYIDEDDILYVAELGEIAGRDPDVEILPHRSHARVTLMDLDGQIVTRFGGADLVRPGNFFAPHGIRTDSKGDLYVAEVVYSGGGNRGLVSLDCHALHALAAHLTEGAVCLGRPRTIPARSSKPLAGRGPASAGHPAFSRPWCCPAAGPTTS